MSYRARDGNIYSHKESPREYSDRKAGRLSVYRPYKSSGSTGTRTSSSSGDVDSGCCGCLVLIALFFIFF